MIIPMLCVTIFVILVVWFLLPRVRSEERRVGKECRSAGSMGDCQYKEMSFVFDEQNSSSYSTEIAHMSRYYRLHLGSFLAIELAKQIFFFQAEDGIRDRSRHSC